jgi:hypothetical protein
MTAEIFFALWRAASLEKRGGFDGWGFSRENCFCHASKSAYLNMKSQVFLNRFRVLRLASYVQF